MIVGDIERATSHWRHEAAGLGLPRQQIDRMVDAYETAERRTARALSLLRVMTERDPVEVSAQIDQRVANPLNTPPY